MTFVIGILVYLVGVYFSVRVGYYGFDDEIDGFILGVSIFSWLSFCILAFSFAGEGVVTKALFLPDFSLSVDNGFMSRVMHSLGSAISSGFHKFFLLGR